MAARRAAEFEPELKPRALPPTLMSDLWMWKPLEKNKETTPLPSLLTELEPGGGAGCMLARGWTMHLQLGMVCSLWRGVLVFVPKCTWYCIIHTLQIPGGLTWERMWAGIPAVGKPFADSTRTKACKCVSYWDMTCWCPKCSGGEHVNVLLL